jgi:hypothetical protein
METSFNVIYSRRLTHRNKQWCDGVAVFSKPLTAKRFTLRVVDEDGAAVVNAFTDSIPSENDEITVAGVLIQISTQLTMNSKARDSVALRQSVLEQRTFSEILAFFSAPPTVEISLRWDDQPLGAVPTVPVSFVSADEYRRAFMSALEFELNVKIHEVFLLYLAAVFSSSRVPAKCPQHGPAIFCVGRRGGYFYRCAQCQFRQTIEPGDSSKSGKNIGQIAAFLEKKGVAFHTCMFLRRSSDCVIQFLNEKSESTEYSKGDLWVLLGENQGPVFAVSESYGVYSGNRVEIAAFVGSSLDGFANHAYVTAVHLFTVQSEQTAIAALSTIEPVPILPSMLGRVLVTPIAPGKDGILRLCERLCADFALNIDQIRVMNAVARFFIGPEHVPPIVLVHGVFGAGKSRLLSVIALFLAMALDLLGSADKILVAASTNVAVDNVLEHLVDVPNLSFTRVGSVRKIRKCVLPFVTGHGDEESISELCAMDAAPEVRSAIATAQLEQATHTSRVESSRVTGATCAAMAFPVMRGKSFRFVLLDECSQQTEPMSMIPISFGCQFLVCCGDPLQLPPTVAHAAPQGYERPLFTRLTCFYPPVILSMQYRCHPRIARICSRIFYRDQIVNGVGETDRPPIEGVPIISLFDVMGRESFTGRCVENEAEAAVAAQVVRWLLARTGIHAERIAVITFYRAQVAAISRLLMDSDGRPAVDVSTVDAFQGDEREVVIISTSRTEMSAFVEARERVNVAISRARTHLIVISNVNALFQSDIWGCVFNAAQHVCKLRGPPGPNWNPFECTTCPQ